MKQESLHLALIVLMVVHVTLLVLGPLTMDQLPSQSEVFNAIGYSFLTGCATSQVMLLAVWAALAAEDWTRRVPRAAIMLGVGWCAFVAGLRISDVYLDASEAIVFGLFAVVLFVVMGLLLWIVRLRRGMVLENEFARQPSGGAGPQFSLLQLIGWVTAAGFLLAVARFVLPDEQPNWYVMEVPAILAGLTIWSANGVLIAAVGLAASFARAPVFSRLMGFVFACLLLVGLTYAVLTMMGETQGSEREVFMTLIGEKFGAGATLVGSLLVLRHFGLGWRPVAGEDGEICGAEREMTGLANSADSTKPGDGNCR